MFSLALCRRTALWLLICATFPRVTLAQMPRVARARIDHKNHIPLPPVPQPNNYYCGVSALVSVLQYYGRDKLPQREYARQMHTNSRSGTSASNLARALAKSGLTSTQTTGMTLERLEEHVMKHRRPVIVDFQDKEPPAGGKVDYANTWDHGHWAVVVGMNARFVYFMDPWTGGARGHLGRKDFLARWHSVGDEPGSLVQGLGIVVHSDSKPLNRAFLSNSKLIY